MDVGLAEALDLVVSKLAFFGGIIKANQFYRSPRGQTVSTKPSSASHAASKLEWWNAALDWVFGYRISAPHRQRREEFESI